MAKIYKILTEQEWNNFKEEGSFQGSLFDKKDGFIHLTFAHQYLAKMAKYFKGINPIYLVTIDPELLDEKNSLKVEANKMGGEKYPHIYGQIPIKAVISYEIIDSQ
jgi:uncharacterized protein (DUF952 family)